jgi:hypothetical protein
MDKISLLFKLWGAVNLALMQSKFLQAGDTAVIEIEPVAVGYKGKRYDIQGIVVKRAEEK